MGSDAKLRRFAMKLRIVLALLLVAVLAGSAFADGLIVPIRPDYRVRGYWAVKYHKVNIKVRDQVADVSIDQVFINTGPGMMEAEYLFPLPPTAAIDSLTLMVDGKEFKGTIYRADEARRMYMEIVRTKRDPALLEYVNYGLYRTSAFPLMPGKEVRVAIHYTDVCKKDGDLVEVFYPLNTEKFSARPLEEVEVKVDIQGKGPISAVYSPTHAVTVDRPAPDHVLASYRVTRETPTTDFRLLYQPSKDAIGSTVLSYRPKDGEDGYFLMMVSPAPRVERTAVIPKNLVIALDHSGSMSGEKLDQAKSSLTFVLRNLNPQDRFNVIAYNDAIDPLFDGLVANGKENVDKALGMIDRISAGGATNIHDALQAALKAVGTGAGDKRTPYVLFLTDGLPTAGLTSENVILKDTLSANSTNARVFAMGIGYDVNVRLLDNLVGQNRGLSAYVKERENLEPKIASLYNKIKSPVMTDLVIKFSDARTTMTYPQTVPDLFDGDQIIMVGRYAHPGRTGITVTGSLLGKNQTFEYSGDLASLSDKFSYAFVEQLWAVRRIGYLLDQIQLNGQSTEVVDELVRLSKKYGIITPYTSFLADERIDLASNFELNRQAQKNAMDLSAGIAGGMGQTNSNNRMVMNQANQVPAQSTIQAAGAAQIGNSNVGAYEANQVERIANVQAVGNRALYRRGQQWIDSDVADQPVDKLNAAARAVAQFSDEYFKLVLANNTAENQILASQQPGQDLIVRLRGQLYRITPAPMK
jgi:Ca-activated chloride channel homolog